MGIKSKLKTQIFIWLKKLTGLNYSDQLVGLLKSIDFTVRINQNKTFSDLKNKFEHPVIG